ncbi:MAG: hypothetical protein LBS49_13080, partial [Candidatus Accumulibacter sp.]|nr:hypothetical protein [Accumulibacter sp.]
MATSQTCFLVSGDYLTTSDAMNPPIYQRGKEESESTASRRPSQQPARRERLPEGFQSRKTATELNCG